MAPRYLLGTSVLVQWLRGRALDGAARFDAEPGRFATSTITAMELEYGCARSLQPAAMRVDVESLLAMMPVLPFDRAAAAEAGRVRAELAAAGTPIGPFDSLIAGHGRSQRLILATLNAGKFSRIQGLQVADWRV
jgi:tRNA(fMet)-specific endonuclease VapC